MPIRPISGDVTCFYDTVLAPAAVANQLTTVTLTPLVDPASPEIPFNRNFYWNVEALTSTNPESATARKMEFFVDDGVGAPRTNIYAKLPVESAQGRATIPAGEAASWMGRFIVPFGWRVGVSWAGLATGLRPDLTIIALQSHEGGVVL